MLRNILIFLYLLIITSTASTVDLDLATWSHPVRSVLEQNSLNITNVTLTNSTYPHFYLETLDDFLSLEKEAELKQLLWKIFKSNGYWDFSLIDHKQNMEISVLGDRKNRDIISVRFNDNIDFYDSLNTVNVNEFKSKHLLSDSIITVGDIESDGILETVVQRGDEYLLMRIIAVSSEVLCTLQCDISVVQEKIGARFVKVDVRDTFYAIRVDHYQMMNGGRGYSLFDVKDNRAELITFDFPNSTGSGRATLIDIDHDGVLEKVRAFYIEDTQQRYLASYTELNENTTFTKSRYVTPFIYPQDDVSLIKSFIHSLAFNEEFGFDFRNEIKTLCSSDYSKEGSIELLDRLSPTNIISYGSGLEITVVGTAHSDNTTREYKISEGSSDSSPCYITVRTEDKGIKVVRLGNNRE